MNKLIQTVAIKQFLKQTLRKTTVMLSMVAILATTFPNAAFAGRIDEPPTPAAMVGDVITRPIMLGATIIGTGLFLATLPFSLIGGNAGQAGDVLVVKPFQATFMRCLGCTDANSSTFGGRQPVDK
jgi:hypothetical protein